MRESVLVEPIRLAKWSTGAIAILGGWVIAAPLALGMPSSGTLAYWSNVSSGAIILVLAVYVGNYLRLRSAAVNDDLSP